MTQELRDRLVDIPDVNGNPRSEFPALFDAIAQHDGTVASNYERFFEWLALIGRGQTEPFHKLTRFRLEQHLVTAAAELTFVIKFPIWSLLRSRHQCDEYQPSYFARLGDFVPDRGRLKVFTTNYDLCIEDACRTQGIDVITGFQPNTGKWCPSLFRRKAPGINLYKLHSSLNWSPDLRNLEVGALIERYPLEWLNEPELILGPGPKLQHDDPFVTLYSEFHRALRRASVCVAIGYSFRDYHIQDPVRTASQRGMKVVDVNPSD